MTAKCCRDCIYHSEHVSNRDYCIVWHDYILGHPDTFYCSSFTRRNSAKVSVKPEVEDNCECSEDFTDGTPFCQQCGKKRVVIPPIQRRFT